MPYIKINVPEPSSGTSGSSDVNLHDGGGAAITSTVIGPATGIDANIIGGDITIDNAELNVELSALDGDNVYLANSGGTELATAGNPLRVDPTGSTTQPISAAALPLPTGASTAALQTTGNASLASIDTKLTAPLSVTGPLTDAQLRASAVPISAASLPLPTGAATAALQTQPGVDIGDVTVNNAAGASAVNIQDGGNSITVDGPLTDAELRASAVPVSAASLPLPTNAATETTLAAAAASLSVLDDWDESDRAKVNPIVGSAGVQGGSGVVSANTQRVVLATDVALPAGTNNIGDVDVLTLPAVTQGTPAATANRWPVQLTDGTDLALVTAAGELNVLPSAQPGVDIGDVTVNNASGASAVNIQDGGNSITVDGTVAVSGTVAISAVSLPLPTGAATAALQTQPGVDIGDVTINNASGASAVNIQDGGNSITVDGSVSVSGAAADDAGVSGNPLLTGFEARQTNRTAVSNGDAVRGMADDMGRQVVTHHQVRDLVTDNNITLTTTSETTLLAAVASTFLDLTMLVITNSSSTATTVSIRDATAGTVRMVIDIAANGGAVIPFPVPRPQTTTNNNWTAQLGTGVTSIHIYAQAVQNV